MKIVNPSGKFSALMVQCLDICAQQANNVAKEQIRLNNYKEKNEQNVLIINQWQEKLNFEIDNISYLESVFSETLPALFNAEGKRQFLKGRELEKENVHKGADINYLSAFVSVFKDDQEKEAIRHYSIAQQRIKDNI